MAGSRCGCSQDRCGCEIVAGPNVEIAGNGTKSNPYVVAATTPTTVPSGGGGTTITVTDLTGKIVMYAGGSAPSGYLICDGSAVSRTVYADLFAICGVTYGAGNGTSTFNLPNLVDRFPVGSGGNRPRGSKGGNFSNSLTVAQMPAHSHGFNHTHRIDHQHPTTVTPPGEGTHYHNEPRFNSASAGTSHTTFVWGAGTSTPNIATGSDHQHTIPQQPYIGGSYGVAEDPNTTITGTGQPFTVEPPYQSILFLIKT